MFHRRSLTALCFLAALVAVLQGPAAAQDQAALDVEAITEFTADPGFQGFIAQAREQYDIYVFGDTLADGLSAGLARLLAGNEKVKVHQRSRAGTGLARPDRYNWNQAIASLIQGKRVDIAIVFIGANDTHSVTTLQGQYRIGSAEWRKAYTAYVDQFVLQLKEHGTAVYWIGLPVMWRPDYDEAVRLVSEIHRERVLAAGMKFLNIRGTFADQQGKFTRMGFDLQGQFRRLRSKDGVHFLRFGNDKLAALVYQAIEKDIQYANKGVVSDFDSGADDGTGGTRVTTLNLPIFAQESETGASIPVDLGQQIAVLGDRGARNNDPAAPRNQPSFVLSGSAQNITFSPQVAPDSMAAKVLLEGEAVEAKPGRADDFSWSAE